MFQCSFLVVFVYFKNTKIIEPHWLSSCFHHFPPSASLVRASHNIFINKMLWSKLWLFCHFISIATIFCFNCPGETNRSMQLLDESSKVKVWISLEMEIFVWVTTPTFLIKSQHMLRHFVQPEPEVCNLRLQGLMWLFQ